MTASTTAPNGNYLVLGSTGMVGSHALLALSRRDGVHVRAVYNKRQPHIFEKNIDYVHGDLTDRNICRQIMSEIDYVLMFAGRLSTASIISRDPIPPVMANLIMTSQCLEAAYYAGVKKFVWLSSTTGYPPYESQLNETHMFDDDPSDVYYPVGWMTRYIETLCKMYSEKLNRRMVTIALRPTLIYGEYDDFDYASSHFLPALIRKVVERSTPVEVWGNGDQTRDLIYVGDVVRASLMAIERTEQFEAFNIAFGTSYTVNQVLKSILKIDGYLDAPIVHLSSKPSTISHRSFSTQKAKDILGFVAATTIDEGIKKTVLWYRANHEALNRF